jgi:hypothetical protein
VYETKTFPAGVASTHIEKGTPLSLTHVALEFRNELAG